MSNIFNSDQNDGYFKTGNGVPVSVTKTSMERAEALISSVKDDEVWLNTKKERKRDRDSDYDDEDDNNNNDNVDEHYYSTAAKQLNESSLNNNNTNSPDSGKKNKFDAKSGSHFTTGSGNQIRVSSNKLNTYAKQILNDQDDIDLDQYQEDIDLLNQPFKKE